MNASIIKIYEYMKVVKYKYIYNIWKLSDTNKNRLLNWDKYQSIYN
jgi:hypothetical protein